MIISINSKRTPPPHLEIRVSGAPAGTRLLAALCAAALLFASCEKPTDPGPASYTAAVKGTVRDSSGGALPGATVSASTTPVTTAKTDSKGVFSFQITHSGSLKFDLTVEKACYETASAKSITLTNNTPHDAEVTTLTLKPEPTEEGDRYAFTRKPDGSYKLTVKQCVTAIPQDEFSASIDDTSPIIQRLAESSGKSPREVLTEIELPSTLRTIGNFAFISNQEVTGTLTIPRNVETIGRQAFQNVGIGNLPDSSTIASSRRAPAIAFESGSKLRIIGQSAFEYSGSKVPLLTLPDGLETIEVDAFRYFVVPPSPLVIPASVRKIGNEAFRSASGINGVTIRSTNLTKDAAAPRLGNNLFGESTPAGGGAATRLSTITTIKLPAAVYNSYSSAERTAIFGSEVTAYQDLEGNPHPTE